MPGHKVPRHIHLIESGPLGHGPLWLGYMLDALQPCVDRITITHPDLPAYRTLQRRASDCERLTLRPIAWRSDKRSWRDALAQARALRADLTLLTFVDTIIKRYHGDLRRKLGTPILGIWFLPNPRQSVPRFDLRRLYSGQARGRHRDQRVLRHVPDWLSGVFVLDELLKERISPRPGLEVHVLPDPWPTRPTISREQARAQLGLPSDRKIFLHFGVANRRKGLADAIEAWNRLNGEPQALLFRAGLTLDDEVRMLAPLTDRGQAILKNERIPDAEVDLCFRACDWVLLPYRRHEGSSGLLSAAAAASRPVIAADYSVIGERVRSENLGLVFEHLSVEGLARAIHEAIHTATEQYAEPLRAYAASHDVEHFNQALRTGLNLHRYTG